MLISCMPLTYLGSWVTTAVDKGTLADCLYTSIVLDKFGNAHISYLNDTDGNITSGDPKYATNASGSWVTSDCG